MEKTIYILRHGQTDYNLQRIVQGSGIDAPLNATGRQQATAFFQRYRDVPFEAVLTSGLVRTHQTVESFIEQGMRWERFEELNEMSWGKYEGRPGTPELKADYQRMVAEWQAGNYDYALEGAESARQLADRLQRFIDHLVGRPERHLLVCSHGRAMRCLVCLLKQEPLHRMEQYPHDNTGLYHLQYHPETRFTFLSENDLQHLETTFE